MNLLYGNEWVDKSTRVTTAEGYNFNFPGWNHIGNATTFQSGQSTTKTHSWKLCQSFFIVEKHVVF